MKKVFVINPGYSLGEAVQSWKKGEYPGSVLYGVNHFHKYGWIPVFEKSNMEVGEKARGSKYIVISRIRTEIQHLIEICKNRNADIIYLPLINFGMSVILLRKLGIIRKPLAGLVHSVNFKNKWKKLVYEFMFCALDYIIFIAEKPKTEFDILFPKYKYKSTFLELMPEVDKTSEPHFFDKKYKYSLCMIGKTHRDYQTFADTIHKIKCKAVLIGGGYLPEYQTKYIDVNRHILNYKECSEIYKESKVNLVIVKEAGGIYGMTSILDSLQQGMPVIATRTKYLSVNIEKEGLGLEVSPSSTEQLEKACLKLLSDQDFYNHCVKSIHKRNKEKNTNVFAEKLCRIFDFLSSRS